VRSGSDDDNTLFAADPPDSAGSSPVAAAGPVVGGARVVRVLPDVPAIDKLFDYAVPAALAADVRVGTMVRVGLHGRRVGGWVVDDEVTPPAGVTVRALAKVTGWGPPPELIELASWAAWRWAGRAASFLGTASPDRAVVGLPLSGPSPPPGSSATGRVPRSVDAGGHEAVIAEALGQARAVLRLPPAADLFAVVVAAAAQGDALVLAPSVSQARHLASRLRRMGLNVALAPKEWARARAGAIVVGSRAAAWAPMPHLAAAVVLDEHDEVYQEERSPTWHAREVVIERARRARVPCVLVSPVPTLEALAWAGPGGLITASRGAEREGWPVIDVVDRRKEDPGRAGLYSDRLVSALRAEGTVVCVLNRKGRSRLLACAVCGEAARCEQCQAAVNQSDDGTLVCRRCGTGRPKVCAACGSTAMKNLRAGVTRAREELEALAREPVVEITGDTGAVERPGGAARIFVGTEAVLHQVPSAAVVAFLDFDQELLAPRYRAAEQAMTLLVRAARLLARRGIEDGPAPRGRAGLGRLVVQTRVPHHEVIQAALHADPSRVADAELVRRTFLRFPPAGALADVSGVAAPRFIESLGHPVGVDVLGPSDGHWLVRATDHQVLCDALAATPRPPGRLRVEVDPLRI
jgi:primosomal protein N' (replication factor Y)